jgi:hypothetical protein
MNKHVAKMKKLAGRPEWWQQVSVASWDMPHLFTAEDLKFTGPFAAQPWPPNPKDRVRLHAILERLRKAKEAAEAA